MSKAELVFESCAIANEGKIGLNKQNVITAEFEEPSLRYSLKPNCEAHVGKEGILKALIRTYRNAKEEGGGAGTNGSMLFEGNMKYRTSSPKCTYETSKFEAEFKVKGNVEMTPEKPMTSEGKLVAGESESGCASSKEVVAKGIVRWEIREEVASSTLSAKAKNRSL